MKQNRPSASFRKAVTAFVFLTVFSTACVTLPRQNIEVQMHAGSAAGIVRININRASAAELQTLPGIGRVTAERIVAHRTQYGAFRRAEHLMMVRGISDRKFREIRRLITIE